jgi:hypothetical protein
MPHVIDRTRNGAVAATDRCTPRLVHTCGGEDRALRVTKISHRACAAHSKQQGVERAAHAEAALGSLR